MSFDNPPDSKANKFTCTEEVMPVQEQLFALGRLENGVITSPPLLSLVFFAGSRNNVLASSEKDGKRFIVGGSSSLSFALALLAILHLVAPQVFAK